MHDTTRQHRDEVYERWYQARGQRWLRAIGQRVQAAREAAGWSRSRLARQIGSSLPILRRIEEGTDGRYAMSLVFEIARVLKVRGKDLTAEPDPGDDPPEARPPTPK